MRFRREWCAVLVVAVAVLMGMGTAQGAGFALIEQSVSGLGNAYAGGAASAEDASTIFYNPAGMTLLNGTQASAAGHIIIPSAKFQNQGSTHLLQPLTGVPLLGGNGGDGGVTKFVPNFYYVWKLHDRLAFGIGIETPFGLATDYDSGWVGRYHALESDVLTMNINPSIAVKLTDQLSAGVGFNIMYMKAKLSNAIDFGTLDAIGALPTPKGSLGLIPQKADGIGELEGDSWGVGFNLGLLYEFTKNSRVGVAYRSRVKQNLGGDVTFSGVPTGLNPYPVFKNTDISGRIDLPDSFSASFFHRFNEQWAVMGDFSWMNWSAFKELRINYANPYQPATVTTENWQDSYRYSLGVTYNPNAQWTLRTGVAYDTSAVADEKYRTPRIPDGYRTWAAFGVGYKFSKSWSMDAGYAHLFVTDAKVNKSATGEDAVRGGLKGYFENKIDIISAQLNYAF